MDINIHFDISVGLNDEAKGWIMSALSDKIAELSTHVDTATTRVTADVASLKAQIATLQTTIDSGGATAEDLAALQTLEDRLDQIDPATPAVLAPPA